MKLPERYEFWSGDEVAECTNGLKPETTNELWRHVAEADKAGKGKPLGGDGPDETEEPIVSSGEYGTDMVSIWPKLTIGAQKDIIAAAKDPKNNPR